jgi:hypothetical protein
MLLMSSYYSHNIKPFASPFHVGGFNRFSIESLLIKEKFLINRLFNFAMRAVFLVSRFSSKQFIIYLGSTLISSVAFIRRRENNWGYMQRRFNTR